MTTVGLGIEVAPPPLLPPAVGLLSAARVVGHGNEPPEGDRWFGGMRWYPASDVTPEGVAVGCNVTYAFSAAASTDSNLNAETNPFAIVVRDICSTFNIADLGEARAREALAAKEWSGVEAELERGGIVSTNAKLAASTAATPAGSTALPARNALAACDEAIANARIGLGMIHAPSYVVALWTSAGMVRGNVGDVEPDISDDFVRRPISLFSPAGNIIVSGSGYRGAAPSDGSVDGTHATLWAYATDLMVVHRSAEVQAADDDYSSLNTATNTRTHRVWRTYAIEWSKALHAAIPVAAGWDV